jgi:probable DNA metabolism protein
MNLLKILRYDGSFEGLLCCIFRIYEEKILVFKIVKEDEPLSDLFADVIDVITDEQRAQRVWAGIQRKSSQVSIERILLAYLSEIRGEEHTIVRYVQYLIDSKRNIEDNLSHPVVQRLQDVVKMVHRERHRMKAFVRFQLLSDGIYYSGIDPDFNVLPLIKDHFKHRYADQQWIIYDLRRNYGLYYNLKEVLEMQLEVPPRQQSTNIFQEEEVLYQELWKKYFKHTNIVSRKNTQLHIRHVPKRYWKYLTEKML